MKSGATELLRTVQWIIKKKSTHCMCLPSDDFFTTGVTKSMV